MTATKRLGAALGLVALGAALPCLARAQPTAEPDAAVEPEPADGLSRPVASVLAFLPGIVLHGSGHFALGQRTTAYRLLAMQGIGIGLMALGALPIVVTGASRYVTGPSAAVAMAGVGITATAWLGDLFGTLVPPEVRGLPELSLPIVETEIGYRYAYHPAISYGNVVVNRLALRWDGWLLEPSAWYAIDGRSSRLRAALGYRYFGPRAYPAPRAPSGSFLEITAAATEQRFPADSFHITTGELSARARLDLHDLDPLLGGMFSEVGLGFGLERYDYDVLGHGSAALGRSDAALGAEQSSSEVPGDYAWLLLGRLGVGFYLGGEQAPAGELLLYYDHRHDDLAGGLHQAFVGIGGHVGATASLYLSDELGVRAEFEAGGGILGGASLLVRKGVAP